MARKWNIAGPEDTIVGEKKEEEKKRRREDVKGNRAEANGIGQISRSVTVFPGHISRARSNEKF